MYLLAWSNNRFEANSGHLDNFPSGRLLADNRPIASMLFLTCTTHDIPQYGMLRLMPRKRNRQSATGQSKCFPITASTSSPLWLTKGKTATGAPLHVSIAMGSM